MNVYGHLFQDKHEKLTNDLDALVERIRPARPARPFGGGDHAHEMADDAML
jgi:hypothetical protein